MKKLYFPALLLLMLSVFTLKAEVLSLSNPDVSTAIDQALEQVKTTFESARAKIGKKSIAILPVASDPQGILTGKLKNFITNNGCHLVASSQGAALDNIFKEIGWSDGKTDILEKDTIAQFGKLKAVEVLFTASVQISNIVGGYCVQLDFHAYDVATREHVWGGNFLYRYYIDGAQKGIIRLDEQLRLLLKENMSQFQADLQQKIQMFKARNIKVVAVLPLGGDIDGYITHMTKELLTNAGFETQTALTSSAALFRYNQKNDANAPQGYLCGTVRGLSRKLKQTTTSDETITTTWEVSTDIQLTIADTKTGNGLWNKTIHLPKDMSETRQMTQEELDAHSWTQFKKFCYTPFRWIGDNPKTTFIILGIVLGAAVVFLLLLMVIKFFISNKFIR